MVRYLFKVTLFCVIQVYCEEYFEINNSVSLDSDENPDMNEVFDSAEYLDTRDDEVERNNTEYNKSQNFETYTEAISPLKEDIVHTPVKKKSRQSGKGDSYSDLKVSDNITTVKKCTAKREQSGENKISSEETECNNPEMNLSFSVSIQRKGSHYTTGVLLSNQTVLTVAADFYNVRESIKLYRVRLGSVDCKKGGLLLHIKSIHIHPFFVQGNPAFDLAVIKLSEPVALTEHVKPIPLSNVTQKVISAKFMTSYWPRLIVKGHALPKTAKERIKHHYMRISTQKMIPWKACYGFMESTKVLLDHTSLCLKPISSHHTICMPDPGAPVIAEDVLWGITSGWTSELCQSFPSPTIVTRVALKPVRKWLETLLYL